MTGPFRFLDLPKELRLMIYDYLPVKTTHHKVPIPWNHDTLWGELRDLFNNGDDWIFGEFKTPKQSLTLVHTTIPGSAVLRVSRVIASEARAILQPKLTALRATPIQIIANTLALGTITMFELLSCVSDSRCRMSTDIRIFLCPNHFDESHDHPLQPHSPEKRRICIAIHNAFKDELTAPRRKTTERMVYLGTEQYGALQWRLTDHYTRNDPEKHTRDLEVSVRLALLCVDEKRACREVGPLDTEVLYRASKDTASLHIWSNVSIESDEWENKWAEGESLLTDMEKV
jgi:hypothetical protein